MSVLDAVLVLACLAFAVSGYRQGFVTGVLSFGGFCAGGALGMLVAPRAARDLEPGLTQSLVAVAVVLTLAALGQALASMAGARLRARMTWHPVRRLDATLGAVVTVTAVLVVSWFVAGALRASPVPEIAASVRDSVVVTTVDQAMPDRARGLFGSFRTVLDPGSFPRVFSGLDPERIAPVDPPDVTGAQTPAVAAAAASVVRVVGAAQACSQSVSGSGFVYAPNRVMTNAHVVAGVDSPSVQLAGQAGTLAATVVAFDPDRDLAVLAVPDLVATPLPLQGEAGSGADAAVAGFPKGGPFVLAPARVRERITARGPDIYSEDQVTRDVYSLFARVQPGNSGGPLLATDGTVLGVVFATSLDDPQTGYALTAAEAEPVATAGIAAEAAVDTGTCTG